MMSEERIAEFRKVLEDQPDSPFHGVRLVEALDEVDRLRAALKEISDYTPYHGGECPAPAMAREAL